MSETPSPRHTQDRLGSLVCEGTRVRVVEIQPSVLGPLDQTAVTRVQSMLGEVFPVYEVDQWGRAWVEKSWHEGEEHSTSHSLALEPSEMEVVPNHESNN